MKKLITLSAGLAIFMQPLFFSLMGWLGIEYEGSESSIVYVVYVVTIAALAQASYIYATARKGLLKGEVVVLAVILGLFALHALWVIFNPLNTSLLPEFLIFFLLFGLPGFLSAATVIKLGILPSLIRLSEVFVVLIAIGIIMFSVLPSLGGVRTVSLAGASYQALSYYAAFAFGMLLVYNLHLSKKFRYRFTSHSGYRLGSYALLLGCVLACFLGGGRGAFLLLVVYLTIGTFSIFLDKKNIRTKRGITNIAFKLASIIMVFAIFMTVFWENDFIQSGFNRATQYISADGGIDIERGSSGRNVVYSDALEYIEQQPLLGYGPFGFRDSTIHAHNLFLEISLQFGVIGLLLFLIAGVALTVRAFRNKSQYTIWVVSLFLYPLVMTMFSGTYMHTTIFIFGVSVFTIIDKERQRQIMVETPN